MICTSNYLGILGFLVLRVLADCSPISFTLTTNAENVVFGNLPDPNNAAAVKEFLDTSLAQGPNIIGTQQTSQTVSITGRYCTPPSGVQPLGVVELLVHGITYNKDIWSGFGLSDQYDWEAFATAKGYHTLAIDRLGHGESDKVDPFTVVQGPTHVSILHELVRILREASHPDLDGCSKIVYVGHSYGSAMGNYLGLAHPDDIDAYVLTGYSDTVNFNISILTDLQPAATLFDRFADVPLGYFTFASESVHTESFYDGAFDPAVAAYDFGVEDTVSAGEMMSPGLESVVTQYTGPVFLITGDLDFFFCHEGPDACEGILSGTGRLYPQGEFEHKVVANTGHLLTLQDAAPEVLESVHGWLDKAL